MTNPREDFRRELEEYRALVRAKDPATMEKRRLAREALAPSLPPAHNDGSPDA